MRVLIIGGYGTFGGRLVDLLIDEPRLTLIVAGRDLARAQRFCAARTRAATLEAAQFDRAVPEAALAALRPDIVVDAAGPFQLYGRDPYRVVRAALAAGAHWIDLADAVGFVKGIAAFDGEARAAERFVLAGASSFPVLTAAVVRRLGRDVPRIESIIAGIAPSPFAIVGLNVIRAIASYAGKPVKVRVDGAWRTLHGMISSRTMTVAVPGKVPLSPIRFALVEVPDLEVLAEDWPDARTIWTGAGPTPAILHRLLWLCAWLVRIKLLPSLVPLAPLMDWAVNTFRWGEHRGGMIVAVAGGGRSASWHMLAEGDVGPLIPSMAIEAIIRKCLEGQVPAPGARPAHHELELADYEAMFVRRGISSGVRSVSEGELYERLLGQAYIELPPAIQTVHGTARPLALEGRAEVEGATTKLGRIIGRAFRLPPGGTDLPVRVTMTRHGTAEVWTREFGRHRMQTTQSEGRGRYDRLIVERFGPARFGMAVVVSAGVLSLVLRRWDVLGVPMPRFLMPRVVAGESAPDGRFQFSVEIALPLVGRLVRYRGWLLSSDRPHAP